MLTNKVKYKNNHNVRKSYENQNVHYQHFCIDNGLYLRFPCPNNNSIYVIDLNERKLKKTIYVNEPYNMIIP